MYCSCLYVFKCPWDRSGRSAGTENSDSYTDRKTEINSKVKVCVNIKVQINTEIQIDTNTKT